MNATVNAIRTNAAVTRSSDGRHPNPAVLQQPGEVVVMTDDAAQAIGGGLHDDEEAYRLVDLDHLPRQPGAEIAGVPVHDAEERRDVVRQLRRGAVAHGVDARE